MVIVMNNCKDTIKQRDQTLQTKLSEKKFQKRINKMFRFEFGVWFYYHWTSLKKIIMLVTKTIKTVYIRFNG